jgi:hypothetical protein
MENIPSRQTIGGKHIVTMGDMPSLVWFQEHPYGKSRIINPISAGDLLLLGE